MENFDTFSSISISAQSPNAEKKVGRKRIPAKLRFTAWTASIDDLELIELTGRNVDPLNIAAAYGRIEVWTPSAGVRELVQNLFDGIISFAKSHNVGWKNITCIVTKDSVQGTDLYELFLSGWNTPVLAGWIAIKPAESGDYHSMDVEVYNRTAKKVDFKKFLVLGATTKRNDPDTIGEHGDGLKMGINAILRCRDYTRLTLFSHDMRYDFGGDEDIYSDDEESQTVRRYKKSKTKSLVPGEKHFSVLGVMVRLRDLPRDSFNPENFLFLRDKGSPIDALDPENGEGAILLEESLRGCIFVKGVLVRRPNRRFRNKGGSSTRIFYAVNITGDVNMSRDRIGLEDPWELAEHIFSIWAPCIQTSFHDHARARKLLLELLLDETVKTIEMDYLEEMVNKEDARIIFTTLQEREGQNAFFFDPQTSKDAIRIIENLLQMTPRPIPAGLMKLLHNHGIIRTPDEERFHRFQGRSDSTHQSDDSPFIKHTLHVIKELLRIDQEALAWRGTYKFVTATKDDLMCAKAEDEDTFKKKERKVKANAATGQLLLNEMLLSSKYIHSLHAHDLCTVAPRDGEGDMWDSQLDICDCAALEALDLIIAECGITDSQRIGLVHKHRNALKDLPRRLKIDKLAASPSLVWATDRDDKCNFIVKMHRVVSPEQANPAESVLGGISEVLNDERAIPPPSINPDAQGEGTSNCLPEAAINATELKVSGLSLPLPDSVIPGIEYCVEIMRDWHRDSDTMTNTPWSFTLPLPSPHSSPSSEAGGIDWKASRLNDYNASSSAKDAHSLVDNLPNVLHNYHNGRTLDNLHSDSNSSFGLSSLSDSDPDNDYESCSDPEEEIDDWEYDPRIAPPRIEKPPQSTEVDAIQVGDYIVKKGRYYCATPAKKPRVADGKETDFILYISKIEKALKPAAKSHLYIRRYIRWTSLYPEGPPDEILLCYDEEEGIKERRAVTDFETLQAIHPPIHRIFNAGTAGVSQDEVVCQWGYARQMKGRAAVIIPIHLLLPKLVPGSDLQEQYEGWDSSSLFTADLFCGVGGSSLGFSQAGFDNFMGVEKNPLTAMTFELNHPDSWVYDECVETFLFQQPRNYLCKEQLAVLLMSTPCQGFSTANPGGKEDRKNRNLIDTVPIALRKLKPAFLFYENVPGLAANHVKTLWKLVYSILLEGYSVKFKVLRCEEYGVASIRKRLILLAAEPGRSLPEWPAPTHNSDMVPFVTLGQAIERFPLNSLTCRLGKHGVLPHHGDVENHCTGCSEAKLETWDDNTIPSLDEPICTIRTGRSNRWKCRHPIDPSRYLTVRELASAMGFEDTYKFRGSVREQIRQVGNSVPPPLARAVAQEIRKTLLGLQSVDEDRIDEDRMEENNAEVNVATRTSCSSKRPRDTGEEAEPVVSKRTRVQ